MKAITFVGGPLHDKEMFVSDFPPYYMAALPLDLLEAKLWDPDEDPLPLAYMPELKTVRYRPVKDSTDDWFYVLESQYHSFMRDHDPEYRSRYEQEMMSRVRFDPYLLGGH